MTQRSFFAAVLALAGLCALPAQAEGQSLILQSTTSTKNSGLYDFLLPVFEEATDIKVHVVAVGTGQAIRNAQNCDGDVLIVHAKAAEEAFIAAGFGTARHDLMYNDFVIVGPSDDPAGIKGDDAAALTRIAASEALFASRGDDSGTHKKEIALWGAVGLDPASSGKRPPWYLSTGSGMGATLNIAAAKDAYALTDRATWISFGNKGALDILVEGDKALFNQYGVIAVSPLACSSVNAEAATQLIDWLLSDAGQERIAAYEVNGQKLFTPNGARDE